MSPKNIDEHVVSGFGDEWRRFDQASLTGAEYERMFASYFKIFPWGEISRTAEGFDLGCGSGRWARGVAPRVGRLHCIDASSEALRVARDALRPVENIVLHLASVDCIPLPEASMDFGYCLGVLHHVPDTQAGLLSATSKLKRGAPFLLYLYYALENQPRWYSTIWKASDLVRRGVSRLPRWPRYLFSQVLATAVYYPLAKVALLLERSGYDVSAMPLSNYRHYKFYTMRTDALDRFGTKLERRFTRSQMQSMMEAAGLTKIVFSETPPFWCALGTKAE
jgi:SAM-dependent methyltransferase